MKNYWQEKVNVSYHTADENFKQFMHWVSFQPILRRIYGCWQKTKTGKRYEGTVLEHLLLQNLTAFYEVGEHNEIRLRGADWNDALDMAAERGESVAFTNAYAGNLKNMAELLTAYQKKTGKETVKLSAEMILLLEDEEALYASVERRLAVLEQYLSTCEHEVCGDKVEVSIGKLISNLSHKAEFMMKQIRENEWVEDTEQNGWFNGYYDNHGNRVEGEFENGAVFSHMAVMYANALYKRGFAKEGYKALQALEKQAMNFEVSHIYPGIPEYFNARGRGMYHYLTGAASRAGTMR